VQNLNPSIIFIVAFVLMVLLSRKGGGG